MNRPRYLKFTIALFFALSLGVSESYAGPRVDLVGRCNALIAKLKIAVGYTSVLAQSEEIPYEDDFDFSSIQLAKREQSITVNADMVEDPAFEQAASVGSNSRIPLVEDSPVISSVYYQDEVKIWRSPSIWTPSERNEVKALMGINDFNGYYIQYEELFPREIYLKFERRIESIVDKINASRKPNDAYFAHYISIHTTGARNFHYFHLHGSGDITLVISEEGEITETYDYGRIHNNGGYTAIMTDGILHRPPLDYEGERLTIFVTLVPVVPFSR